MPAFRRLGFLVLVSPVLLAAGSAWADRPCPRYPGTTDYVCAINPGEELVVHGRLAAGPIAFTVETHDVSCQNRSMGTPTGASRLSVRILDSATAVEPAGGCRMVYLRNCALGDTPDPVACTDALEPLADQPPRPPSP